MTYKLDFDDGQLSVIKNVLISLGIKELIIKESQNEITKEEMTQQIKKIQNIVEKIEEKQRG